MEAIHRAMYVAPRFDRVSGKYNYGDNETLNFGDDTDITIYYDGSTTFYFEPTTFAGNQPISFVFSDGTNKIFGGDATGDDLWLVANSNFNYSIIEINGNSDINLQIANNSAVYFKQQGVTYGIFRYRADLSNQLIHKKTIGVATKFNYSITTTTGDITLLELNALDNLTIGTNFGVTTLHLKAITPNGAGQSQELKFTNNAYIDNSANGEFHFYFQDGTISPFDSYIGVQSDLFNPYIRMYESGGIRKLYLSHGDGQVVIKEHTPSVQDEYITFSYEGTTIGCNLTSGDAFTITTNTLTSTGNIVLTQIDGSNIFCGPNTGVIGIQIYVPAPNGTGVSIGIDCSNLPVDRPVLGVVADPISSLGTLSGQIAIDVEGTTYYIPYYTHGS